jgi:prophage regulatory protein
MNKSTQILPIIVRMPDVVVMTGMSRPTVYRMMKAGTFPQQIQLSPGAVGWLRTEIEQWVVDKVTADRGFAQAA